MRIAPVWSLALTAVPPTTAPAAVPDRSRSWSTKANEANTLSADRGVERAALQAGANTFRPSDAAFDTADSGGAPGIRRPPMCCHENIGNVSPGVLWLPTPIACSSCRGFGGCVWGTSLVVGRRLTPDHRTSCRRLGG